MLKVRTLFSGIGSPERALKDLQMPYELVDFCEVDKYAVKSYCAVHGVSEEKNLGDITKVWGRNLPYADLMVWGFPCQDISVAGKKLGFKGKRSSLFFTVTRLVSDFKEEDKPSILFIENVKNLLGINGGSDFLKLLIELDEIGYDAEWQVLNSKDFGVPQNRERVFIIGHLRGRSRRHIFPIGGYNSKIAKGFQGDVSGKGYASQQDRVYEVDGLMNCLPASQTKSKTKIIVKENTKKGYVEAYEGDGVRLDHIGGTTARARVQPQRANTLTTGRHAGVVDKGLRIRALTPKECFRLQGWPDEYYERAASVNSDTQLYKQAGNGVTVLVIYEIAKRLE